MNHTQLEEHVVDEPLAVERHRHRAAHLLVGIQILELRLQLRGVDVESRWDAVADRWAPLAGAGNYAFNDWHAMMAFVGASRERAQHAVLESLEAAATGGTGDTALFAREVGLDAARAVMAFDQARFSDAVELLRPLVRRAHRFGGSHAQRDVLDLTLLEAAIRGGQDRLAAALARERTARRPHSPLNRWLLHRSDAGQPQPRCVA